jgi:predicted secreted Zn-dependent protease
MNKKTLLILSLLFCAMPPAQGASLSKTYNYFSIGGSTLDEIESQLSKRGPQLKNSGKRHPGATRMEFTTRLGYAEGKDGSCRIIKVDVAVKARVILPRWRRSKKAEQDVRLIWDTLSSDIKRHEESHVIIAKNHAREMEEALKGLYTQKNCQIAAAKAKAITTKLLEKHDRAQVEFDRIEGKNFENRILRLLRYRLERIGDGRLPG